MDKDKRPVATQIPELTQVWYVDGVGRNRLYSTFDGYKIVNEVVSFNDTNLTIPTKDVLFIGVTDRNNNVIEAYKPFS